MVKNLSTPTRGELIRALKERYMESAKKEKTKILDEFSSVSGYHRKHAVRLLGRQLRIEVKNTKMAAKEAVRNTVLIMSFPTRSASGLVSARTRLSRDEPSARHSPVA